MKSLQPSKIHFDIAPTQVKQVPLQLAHDSLEDFMGPLGFGIGRKAAKDMAAAYGFSMDAFETLVTTASIPNLVQFLQTWMPGLVYVMTADRAIDRLIGLTTMGEFSDDQVIQQVLEMTGYGRPYQDDTNVPLADFNSNYVPRTVVRMELGMRVGILESERNARANINSSQAKREACGLNLEIARNLIGFYGYNSGLDNTYGFLNDPGLNPYITVADGATGSGTWASKTFLEIQQDLLVAIVELRDQSGNNIDAKRVSTTLAVPANAVDYLSKTSDFGVSVYEWLKINYPLVRVESVIQLNTATGDVAGDGGFYLYADRISDQSTDDGKVWVQPVPQKFRVLGVVQLAKAFEEDFANATAGSMCKRPWANVRFVGIS